MNILIVDDVKDNHEGLERLIKQYGRKYQVDNEVYHAFNGQESIEQVQINKIDLVFMDIIMPVMNGIEAIKHIKEKHPSIMIIVISSENDEAVKTEALQSGAEDYVLKPFSSAIMLSRLNNYNKLVHSRNTIGYQTKAINAFTHKVYSYQMKFFLGNDDELAQFWETLLVRLEFQNHISYLSDFVRFLYRLGNLQLRREYKCHVYVEEDAHYFYFTMDNIRLLSADNLDQLIEKHCANAVYEIKGDYLSFALPRTEQPHPASSTVEEKASCSATQPVIPCAPVYEIEKEELQTYDILDEESLQEFEFVLSKLQTEIMMMGSSSLEIDDIDVMNEYIKRLSSLLSISQDAYIISGSLMELSSLLDEYSEPFLAMSKELSHMMSSFINDLVMWKDMIFHTGAPSVDFLDSSIGSNIHMIKALFVKDESLEEELDDIFDF